MEYFSLLNLHKTFKFWYWFSILIYYFILWELFPYNNYDEQKSVGL